MGSPENKPSWTPFDSEKHRQALGKRADISFMPDPFDPRIDTDSDPAREATLAAIEAGALPYTKTPEDLSKTAGEVFGTTDPDELRARIAEESIAFNEFEAGNN